ncbi:MAG: M42 family peptidase, partial [Clostridia bacterium]|nr:M42 family peptidase [Clostridia bacterium]
PDLAVVVEGTTCADIPGVEGVRRSTMLGAGPALTLVDGSAVPDRWLVRRTAAVAEREGIRFQWKRAAVGGTDAARIQPEAGGIPTMVLSVPCRYIHGPCAVMSLDDFAAALALLRALLHDLAAGGV